MIASGFYSKAADILISTVGVARDSLVGRLSEIDPLKRQIFFQELRRRGVEEFVAPEKSTDGQRPWR
jgi:hypothetical protein